VKKENKKPYTVLFMEPDMVYSENDVVNIRIQLNINDIPCLGTTQIELWKNNSWRIPQRPRVGPVMWLPSRAPDFKTHFGTTMPGLDYVSHNIQNHNFGFCLNATTMMYKHLTAIQFSAAIGDSIPSHEWYRDKWLNWTPETRNIEISEEWKHMIPKAELYNMPDKMKKQMEIL
jgi:hypothetical protein